MAASSSTCASRGTTSWTSAGTLATKSSSPRRTTPPASPAPPCEAAWNESISTFRRDHEALQSSATNTTVRPHCAHSSRRRQAKAYARELALVADGAPRLALGPLVLSTATPRDLEITCTENQEMFAIPLSDSRRRTFFSRDLVPASSARRSGHANRREETAAWLDDACSEDRRRSQLDDAARSTLIADSAGAIVGFARLRAACCARLRLGACADRVAALFMSISRSWRGHSLAPVLMDAIARPGSGAACADATGSACRSTIREPLPSTARHQLPGRRQPRVPARTGIRRERSPHGSGNRVGP